MNMYHMRLNRQSQDPIGEVWFMTVLAENVTQARKLASNCAGTEGKEAWLNDTMSTCEPQVYAHVVDRLYGEDCDI